MKHLVSVGSMIHFSGEQALEDLYIINPQWLADVMACMFTFRHQWIKRGIFLHDDAIQSTPNMLRKLSPCHLCGAQLANVVNSLEELSRRHARVVSGLVSEIRLGLSTRRRSATLIVAQCYA